MRPEQVVDAILCDMLKAAIYCRISADPEGRAWGVRSQEEDSRTLAAKLGAEVVGVYVDNDISASTRSLKVRPDYRRLLADASSGAFDLIIAGSTNRLTRRPRENEDLIELAQQHGTRFHYVKSPSFDLNTADGRNVARILAANDAAEAERISERCLRAKAARRQAGLWNGGPRPFGFARNGMMPVETEQALIRQACRDVLDGRSLSSIARTWQAATGGTPQGRPPFASPRWRNSNVGDVLRSPRIAGLLPDGSRAAWDPVVPEGEWRSVRAVLNGRDRRPGRGALRMLSSIARCGSDGCVEPLRSARGRHGRLLYKCPKGHTSVQQQHLDGLVRPLVVGWMVAKRVEAAAPASGLGDLSRRADGLRARLDEAADMWVTGAFTRAQFERATAALRADLAAVEDGMVRSRRATVLAGVPGGDGAVGSWWDGLDVERRRAVLREIGLLLVVRPPGRGAHRFDPSIVTVVWRGPGA